MRRRSRKAGYRRQQRKPKGRRQRHLWRRNKRKQEAERRKHCRARVVGFARVRKQAGHTMAATARQLGICASVLYAWSHQETTGKLGVRLMGRPMKELEKPERHEVLTFLFEAGPQTSLDTLRAVFPELAPAPLRRLLDRFRKIWNRLYPANWQSLQWQTPGIVWAMDNTEPEHRIDNEYGRILVVRDLGSRKILRAMPTPAEDQTQTIAVLRSLFAQHGPPLVIKADNHGSFTGEEVKAFLAGHHVTLLTSPPRTPRYNGSVEAGMGTLKVRIHHQARRHRRPHLWWSDDVEAAIQQTNTLTRPWGRKGPTPDERWQARPRLTDTARRLFHSTVLQELDRIIQTRGKTNGRQRSRASIMRAVVRRQLVQAGHLYIGGA